MTFRGIVELNGTTATGIPVPEDVVADLGGGKRPKVRVTINGYSYRSSVGSLGGRSMLPVSAQIRPAGRRRSGRVGTTPTGSRRLVASVNPPRATGRVLSVTSPSCAGRTAAREFSNADVEQMFDT